jgi:hypothetical protein
LQVLDDLDTILTRFQQHSYSKAMLFVDNAGADVLLGMVPFARELLKRKTQVGGCQRDSMLWQVPICQEDQAYV